MQDTSIPGEDSSIPGDDAGEDAAMSGDITVTADITALGEPADGVVVDVLDADGNVLSSATASAQGRVSVGAPANEVFFLFVQPNDDAMGTVRVQPPAANDYTVNGGLAMEGREEFEGRVEQAGQTYDLSKGNVVVGFNVANSEQAGETATLGGIVTGSAFVIKSESEVLVQNTVPPLCSASEEPCREIEGRTEVFFPNAGVGTATPVITGGTGTCTVRHFDGTYPIQGDSRTIISVDCE